MPTLPTRLLTRLPSTITTRTRIPLTTNPTTIRTFQTTRVAQVVKETAPGDETRKEAVEREKQAQLAKQKEGTNEWTETLSSESESVLKAERGEIKADPGTIAELQRESVKKVEREGR